MPTASSPYALAARTVVRIALALGTFTIALAWSGSALHPASDGAVVACAALSVALVAALARSTSAVRALVVALVLSLTVGGAVGVSVAGASWAHLGTTVPAAGVGTWIGVALVRVALASPLVMRVHRGASLAARDALDSALLASALWLAASLTEAALVLRAMHHTFAGLAGPALGVATAGTLLVAALAPLAVLARTVRWRSHWNRILADGAHTVVAARGWDRPVPAPPWFHLTPLDGVLVRRVAREGANYREGDVEMALTHVPLDPSRVRRMLLGRIAVALLLGLFTLLAASLVAPLRW